MLFQLGYVIIYNCENDDEFNRNIGVLPMSNHYKSGDVVTGKISGIQPYGAFVALDEDTQGLVHISEIKHGFVIVTLLLT